MSNFSFLHVVYTRFFFMSEDQLNLYNLITDKSDDNDISLQVINKIFDNLDKEDISNYHDLLSYNNLLQKNGESEFCWRWSQYFAD